MEREVARHLIGHVGAAEAFWKMRPSVTSVSRHVTWQLMSYVMFVLFVKKVVSSTSIGYDSPCRQNHGTWDLKIFFLTLEVLFLCMLLLPLYNLMLLNRFILFILRGYWFLNLL